MHRGEPFPINQHWVAGWGGLLYSKIGLREKKFYLSIALPLVRQWLLLSLSLDFVLTTAERGADSRRTQGRKVPQGER